MLPIQENILSLTWIAEYWSREIEGLRTSSKFLMNCLPQFGELS
jgi:hypothetical protein